MTIIILRKVFIRIWILLLFSCMATGCVSSVHLTSLHFPTTTNMPIHVKEIKYGDMINPIGLSEGDYVPELENDEGVFYKGPERCVWLVNSRPYGGLYVPKSKDPREFKIYYFVKTPRYVYADKSWEPEGGAETVKTRYSNGPKDMAVIVPTIISPATLAGAGVATGIINGIIASEGEILFVPYSKEANLSSYVTAQ